MTSVARAVAAGGGMGLGLRLYIAQQIVLAHRGTLTLERLARVGSPVRVALARRPRGCQGGPTTPTGGQGRG